MLANIKQIQQESKKLILLVRNYAMGISSQMCHKMTIKFYHNRGNLCWSFEDAKDVGDHIKNIIPCQNFQTKGEHTRLFSSGRYFCIICLDLHSTEQWFTKFWYTMVCDLSYIVVFPKIYSIQLKCLFNKPILTVHHDLPCISPRDTVWHGFTPYFYPISMS